MDATFDIKSAKIGDIGYLVCARAGTRTAEFDVMREEGDLWTITRVAVPKDYRNQGIGTKLMERLLQWADEEKQTLQAFVLGAEIPVESVDTEGLFRFFARFGFERGNFPGQVVRRPRGSA